jgi:NAD(P)H-dependent flavin oxidoreductase YrpB (nitropropane dioxygenase family)
MRTPICDQLGIEFPLFAFSHCRDVVAAVSKAGGYGVLGALAYSPDQLEIELSWIDDNVDGKPYGVDFAMPEKFVGKGEEFASRRSSR